MVDPGNLIFNLNILNPRTDPDSSKCEWALGFRLYLHRCESLIECEIVLYVLLKG